MDCRWRGFRRDGCVRVAFPEEARQLGVLFDVDLQIHSVVIVHQLSGMQIVHSLTSACCVETQVAWTRNYIHGRHTMTHSCR